MTTSLELNHIGKVYQTRTGEVQALSHVHLSIASRSFVSIVGPSGCGKSTVMRIIAGLEQPSTGSIKKNGANLENHRDDMAVVFQKDVLLAWRSVLDNVLFPIEIKHGKKQKKATVDKAMQLLKSVGLAGFEQKYPHELSGGMKQRVAICRALIQDPQLLLMDEPFGALDALTREQMMYDLLRLSDTYQFTTVFITHSIEEAVFLSDKVVVMSGRPGSIVKEIPSTLSRPRNGDTRKEPEFTGQVSTIRSIFQTQGILAEA
ncbi:ABC transporter ATP-binding protein [Shouchella miscanthi]|uniref:ABC transporter ATP-binding protein n=1 Tax=Shouchella miscanthi TaxID=2598861 RepID=UPI00119CCFDF|nr:ABC transporter ATP-binding protein [Shouchella miscanthi]